MNCQTCNTNIDYRFLTNCARCEIDQARLFPVDPIQGPPERIEKRGSWTKRLINFVYILISSVAGLISGAVILYVGAAFIYKAFIYDSQLNPSASCARGTAIGFMSILLGAFLGTVGGTVFAVKKPLC